MEEIRREVQRAVEERVLEAVAKVVLEIRNSDDPELGCDAVAATDIIISDPVRPPLQLGVPSTVIHSTVVIPHSLYSPLNK